MPYYVDGYLEAPAGGPNNGPKYLAFVSTSHDAGSKFLSGPFGTQSAAQSWADNYNTNPSNQSGSSIPNMGLPNPNASINTLKNLPSNLAKGIAGETLGSFNLGSWFLRVSEILLGMVLIGVGIARITGVQNVVSKAVKAKI